MIEQHTKILDRFLTSVPVELLDEAEQFVKEVTFMCQQYMNTCPITLYRNIPTDKQPATFFRSKNRHRNSNTTGSILNQALQQEKAFERGLDIQAASNSDSSCVIFLPDDFSITFSPTTIEQFTESAAYVSAEELAGLVYQSDINTLTEDAKHILATKVPFYYCIRLK